VRQLVSFAGGAAAAGAIAWLSSQGYVVPIEIEMRFGIVLASGVAIGLLWRARR
jgi:hypothetical protein